MQNNNFGDQDKFQPQGSPFGARLDNQQIPPNINPNYPPQYYNYDPNFPPINPQNANTPYQNAPYTNAPYTNNPQMPQNPYEQQAYQQGLKGTSPPPNVQHNGPFVRLLSVLIAIASLVFAGSYVYNILVPQGTNYATVKSATVGQTYEGNVLLVRDETVYDDDGITDIQYIAEENSYVARTNVVCYVYTSGYSNKERRSLQNFRNDIKDYQVKLLNTESTFDQKMDRLVAEVNSRALEVRDVVQGGNGNMLNLESVMANSIDLRQQYFREKYSEDQKLSRLYDDESTQLKRIESWKKQSHASFDGVVSFYTDGYEYGLTTKNYESFSPIDVQKMLNGQKPPDTASRRGKTDIYRIVRTSDWFALMIIEDSTWNPVQGNTLRLTMEQFKNTTVDATISSFARNGNKLLLRLRVSAPVEPVLNMRSCRAQIGEFSDAISVPERALYTQDNTLGVVVVRGTEKLFVPVELISKANGEAYLKPQYANTLHVGETVQLF